VGKFPKADRDEYCGEANGEIVYEDHIRKGDFAEDNIIEVIDYSVQTEIEYKSGINKPHYIFRIGVLHFQEIPANAPYIQNQTYQPANTDDNIICIPVESFPQDDYDFK
jgi:hypothetical protein